MNSLTSSFAQPLALTESEIRLRTPEPTFETICIARQPILDFHKNLVAYELLFRSLDGQIAAPASGLQTTLSVIHNAFHGIGIEAVLGNLPGFINVDADFLMSDLIESLPTASVVLEVLESVDPTPAIVARICELKQRGYKFALDDYIGEHKRYAALLPEMDVFKVDLVAIPSLEVAAVVSSLRRHPGQLLAEKVESKKDFLRTRALNFDLYQGYHFAHPEMMSGRELKASAPAQLLRLLTLLTQDADTDELVEELKRQPALSYNLIRIANSSAIGAGQKINSIQEATLILGHRQLLYMVQVLMYASQGSNAQNNPLLQMAVVRSRLMETLAGLFETGNSDFQEAAFLTGMLSLIDVLIQMPIQEILADLPVTGIVRDALLHRSGQLGTLLRLCEHLDEHDEASVRRELSEIPVISGCNLMAMQLEAFSWAQKLGL